MREYLKDFSLLYAEDESDVRMKMSAYFESFFKTVYKASDGHEALELYKKHLPDVAILDVSMPKMNGLQVAQEIRKNHTKTRIVMLTAHSEKKLLLEATEIDMSKYLIKPASPSDLKKTLNKVASELISISSKYIKFSEDIIYFIEKGILISKTKEVELSLKEKKLMALLVSKKRAPVTFEDIMATLWDDDFDAEISKDSVKAQVSNLRKKIPAINIENIYGVGYCLKAPTAQRIS